MRQRTEGEIIIDLGAKILEHVSATIGPQMRPERIVQALIYASLVLTTECWAAMVPTLTEAQADESAIELQTKINRLLYDEALKRGVPCAVASMKDVVP